MNKEQLSLNYSAVWFVSVPSISFDTPGLDTIPIDLQHMSPPIAVTLAPIADISHDLVLIVVAISIIPGLHFVVPWYLVGPRLAMLEPPKPNSVPWKECNPHILDTVVKQSDDLVLASTDPSSPVTHHHATRLGIRFECKRLI